MMDTLDKYLVKEFMAFFLAVLLALVVLYLGIDLLSKMWGMKMPMNRILIIYAFKIPKTMQLFLPVACLFAALLVLTNMSRQNEVLALYSSGVGTFRLVSTFVAITATLSTFGFVMFDTLVPAFTKKEMLVRKGLDPSQESQLIYPRNGFWYRSGEVIYNVGRFNPEQNLLEDIRVYVTSPTFYLQKMIRAKRARFANEDWTLEDGFEVAYPSPKDFPVYHAFKKVSGLIPEKPSDFKSLQVDEDTMRLQDLRHYIERNHGYGFDTTGQQVTYHERLALVFTPLIFVLIGIPFATKPLRTHSLAKSIAYCFLIVFLYLVVSKLVISIGKGGHIPPTIAAWFTNVLFLGGFGLLMFRR